MKRVFGFIGMILLILFSTGCSLDFSFLDLLEKDRTTLVPTIVNGTINFEETDYSSFAIYHSDTYDLDNVHKYNDILLETKENIKRANVKVVMVDYSNLLPWETESDGNIVASGSGVIFLEDETHYYTLTNYHVIDSFLSGAVAEIKTYSDTEYFDAEIVTYDNQLDLAVLKFTKADRTDVSIINIFNRLYYQFNPGEIVLAIGNPSSLENNVTFGEFKSMQNLEDVSFRVIYHDASISNGSSGGALVDIDGNLLGINTWGIEDSEDFSFAIPNYIIYLFLINNGILD